MSDLKYGGPHPIGCVCTICKGPYRPEPETVDLQARRDIAAVNDRLRAMTGSIDELYGMIDRMGADVAGLLARVEALEMKREPAGKEDSDWVRMDKFQRVWDDRRDIYDRLVRVATRAEKAEAERDRMREVVRAAQGVLDDNIQAKYTLKKALDALAALEAK